MMMKFKKRVPKKMKWRLKRSKRKSLMKIRNVQKNMTILLILKNLF
jgi:hypothetical protein